MCNALLRREQNVQVSLDGIVLFRLPFGGGVLCIQGLLLYSQFRQLSFQLFSGGQRDRPQTFKLPGSGFKKNDLAFVSPKELFLIFRFPVAAINGAALPVSGGVFGNQIQLCNSCLHSLDGGKRIIHGGIQFRKSAIQSLIAVNAVLCQIV